MAEPTIEAYYLEERTFPPPEEFRRNALVSDTKLHEEAEAGLIVDIDDAAATGRRITELLGASPAASAALGARLRAGATGYDVARVVSELDALYRSLPRRRAASIQPKNRGSSQR